MFQIEFCTYSGFCIVAVARYKRVLYFPYSHSFSELTMPCELLRHAVNVVWLSYWLVLFEMRFDSLPNEIGK
jgi:hypothetical protein